MLATLAALVIVAAALIVAPGVRMMMLGPGSPALAELVESFERGDISPDHSFGDLVREGLKPQAYAMRHDNGDTFGVAVAHDSDSVLIVYTLNGAIYAAQHIHRSGTHTERWYFCDEEVLQRHIALSRRAPSR
ncbi:MAG: hypothetical protein EA379_06895 [Phycisphaerales bacterium]|nr:MAG: hypothetical protein EA379_06895 [Phycisphaerales bacterium]